MPKFTPSEAYELLRNVAETERELRKRADHLLEARDAIIRAFDGDPGIRRAGLAAAAGLSRSRVTWMLNHGSPEGTTDGVQVPPHLRRAIEEIRPDLGKIRTLGTRAS